jgi:hypothetical protein
MTPIVDQPGNSRVTVTDPPNTNFSGTFTQGAAGSSGNYVKFRIKAIGQNLRDGQGWRLTVIDLARSIAAGQQVVMQTITMSRRTNWKDSTRSLPDVASS